MYARVLKERAQLIVRVSVKGELMLYQCSLCDQTFPLSADENAKESMAVLWAAFKDHVREYHPENATSSDR